MSDAPDEIPEEFLSPGPEVSGEQVIIRVGAYNYLFERNDEGELTFRSRTPIVLSDDDEPVPFDPSQYR